MKKITLASIVQQIKTDPCLSRYREDALVGQVTEEQGQYKLSRISDEQVAMMLGKDDIPRIGRVVSLTNSTLIDREELSVDIVEAIRNYNNSLLVILTIAKYSITKK